jgi:hypothetical protein
VALPLEGSRFGPLLNTPARSFFSVQSGRTIVQQAAPRKLPSALQSPFGSGKSNDGTNSTNSAVRRSREPPAIRGWVSATIFRGMMRFGLTALKSGSPPVRSHCSLTASPVSVGGSTPP